MNVIAVRGPLAPLSGDYTANSRSIPTDQKYCVRCNFDKEYVDEHLETLGDPDLRHIFMHMFKDIQALKEQVRELQSKSESSSN